MGAYQGVKTLEVLEGADNYNEWIASRLRKYIKSPAMEIGAGTGNISTHFKHLKSLTLTDIDPALVKQLRNKFEKYPNIFTTVYDVSKPIDKEKLYQTVYSVNVFEHVKEDEKALQNIHKLLKLNGKIVMLVPAKRFAYNDLDKNLGHFRRYEKTELKKKLEKSGFKVDYLEYFNIVGLLSWLVRDRVSRNDQHLKKSHVKIFDKIVPFLSFIEPAKKLPLGISLIAVASKVE